MNNFIVYIHKNRINGKMYVGITCQKVNRRWRNGEAYKQNFHFYNAICKYGWDAFDHIIVKAGLTKTEACDEECRLIEKYHTTNERYGYNRSTGGEFPASGATVSEETRQKKRELMMGRKVPKEICEKISVAKKGRSNGKEGLLGEASGNAKHIYQLDLDGNIVGEFFGTYEVGRKLGFASPQKIGEVCRGQRKTAYGYKWKYAED